MLNLYSGNILTHGKNPRHQGILKPADIDYEAYNSLCGDRLRLTLRLDANQRIEEIAWEGVGCSVSHAAASMLGEAILGKTLHELKPMRKNDVFDMLGIPVPLSRVRCALLPLRIMTVALYGKHEWEQREIEDDD
jgi:nitrogen fixation NifU-like protein